MDGHTKRLRIVIPGRNSQYHTAIESAIEALHSRERPDQSGAAPLAAVDAGCGSGLLSVMVAQALRRHGCGGSVLGVEVLLGVCALAQLVVDGSGTSEQVAVLHGDMKDVCEQAAASRRPTEPLWVACSSICSGPPPQGTRTGVAALASTSRALGAPLLVAELMDASGNGEALLPLAKKWVGII